MRTTGAEVYVASTLDGPLGIAAAVHCAAALSSTSRAGWRRSGSSTGSTPGRSTPVRGAIAVPRGPGLGVKPAE